MEYPHKSDLIHYFVSDEDALQYRLLEHLGKLECSELKLATSFHLRQLPPMISLTTVSCQYIVGVSELMDFLCSSASYPHLQAMNVGIDAEDEEGMSAITLRRLAIIEPVAVDRVDVKVYCWECDDCPQLILHLFRVFHVARTITFEHEFSIDAGISGLCRLISCYLSTRQCSPQSHCTFELLIARNYEDDYHELLSRAVVNMDTLYSVTESECMNVTGAERITHVLGPDVVQAIEQTSAHINRVRCYCHHGAINRVNIDISLGQSSYHIDIVA